MDSLFRLIIADDEQLMRDCLEKFFDWQSMGFCVAGNFENGRQVIEHLKENRADVCLLDIEMPVMSGLEAAKHIRDFHPNCVVVLLSGFGEFEYAQRAIDLGVRKYLLKPVTFDQINTTFTEIHAFLTKMGQGQESTTGKHVNIDDILAFIDENLHDGMLSLTQLAGVFHYNPAYLGRVLKKRLSLNFNEYLMQKRMERAAALLKDSHLHVYEVCRRVGYNNTKYFYKIFKSHYGVAPGEYRNRHVYS